jgi:hypothetical protein
MIKNLRKKRKVFTVVLVEGVIFLQKIIAQETILK